MSPNTRIPILEEDFGLARQEVVRSSCVLGDLSEIEMRLEEGIRHMEQNGTICTFY